MNKQPIDPDQLKVANAEKARKWRAANRNHSRSYMREYMREYRETKKEKV